MELLPGEQAQAALRLLGRRLKSSPRSYASGVDAMTLQETVRSHFKD